MAKTYLAKLKTDFWDEEEGLWAWGMNRHSGETYTRRYTNDQLSYLRLLIALGKKEEAKAHLAKLKQTNLWNKENQLWIWLIQKDGTEVGVHSVEDQLLGALVEGLME